MIQGHGYVIPIVGLSTGTTNAVHLLEFRAVTDKPIAVTSVQGHYRNGDSAENLSFGLFRASAATAGTGITPLPTNINTQAAGFTASSGPTAVTLSPATPLAVFGGNGAANYGWYPSVEESQILLMPADIMILHIVIAPTSALTMDATIGITEL